ncbi:MAG: hypothetical protein GY866_03315 [Proteobacteria bacterium]|nr:hypothetical protein [Pseudomonadota bacterium]
MKTQFKTYFCYLNQHRPVILEREPENFTRLPFRYVARCPNSEIAEMAYKTKLKLSAWQTSEARG